MLLKLLKRCRDIQPNDIWQNNIPNNDIQQEVQKNTLHYDDIRWINQHYAILQNNIHRNQPDDIRQNYIPHNDIQQ